MYRMKQRAVCLRFLRAVAAFVTWESCSRDIEEHGASHVAQRLRVHPPMQETQVRSLGWEDPLEEEMATRSSTLAWRIPQTEEPGGLQSMKS